MIIRELYQTNIEVTQGTTGNSYYNVDIGSTDALVTVTLLDFNGNPVKNKNVTLTVDKGYFTQKGTSVNNQYTFNRADDSKSITVATGDNGKIHGVFTASEWGLCTFSANQTNTQILVTGWKLIQSIKSSSLTFDTYSDGSMVEIKIKGTATTGNTYTSDVVIPEGYRPDAYAYGMFHPAEIVFRATFEGKFECYFKQAGDKTIGGTVSYAKRHLTS